MSTMENIVTTTPGVTTIPGVTNVPVVTTSGLTSAPVAAAPVAATGTPSRTASGAIGVPDRHRDKEVRALETRILVIKRRLNLDGQAPSDQRQLLAEVMRAFKDCRRLFGSRHSATTDLRMDLAVVLCKLKRFKEALEHWRGALSFHETSGDGRSLQACLRNYAECLNRTGRFDQAVTFWERAIAGAIPDKQATYCFTLLGYAFCLMNLERYHDALVNLKEVLPFYEERHKNGIWTIGYARTLTYIARSLEGIEMYAEASVFWRHSIAVRVASPHPKARGILQCKQSLYNNLMHRGLTEEAESIRQDGLAQARLAYGEGHWMTAAFASMLGPIALPADEDE